MTKTYNQMNSKFECNLPILLKEKKTEEQVSS